jgi:exportin-1
MHETFEGVQDMACDTFLKICKKCKKRFVIDHQDDKNHNFLEKLLNDIPNIIQKLQPNHIHIFYEAVGYIVDSAEKEKKENLIKNFMELPNKKWKIIMKNAQKSLNILVNSEIMRDLVNLLKTNVSAAKSLKNSYQFQLTTVFKDILSVYKAYSQIISNEFNKNDDSNTSSFIKNMKQVKKECLKLFEIFVLNSEDTNNLSKYFVPPILEVTLGNFAN